MGKVVHFRLSGGFSLKGIAEGLSALGGSPVSGGNSPSGGAYDEIAAKAGITLSPEEKTAISHALSSLQSLGGLTATRSLFPLPPGGEPTLARLLAGSEVGGRAGPMDVAGVVFLLSATKHDETPSFVLERAAGKAPVVYLGRSVEETESLSVLEANIDDLSPEIMAVLIGCCLDAGALDAWIAPIIMKKGRPAFLLGALCRPGEADSVRRTIFLNSSALGVRETKTRRTALERFYETAKTPWGEVRVKVAKLEGKIVNRAPEFEDAARLSREAGVPVKEIMAFALACSERELK
ncbi:DUF111 family protein [bacterium]|nr:MAG: DUF111 family protein [bacterium]